MSERRVSRHPRLSLSRAGRVVLGLERLLWSAGVVLLVWAFAIVADSAWFQHRAAAQLRDATLEEPGARIDLAREPVAVPEGTPLARLIIPRLATTVVVAEGTSDAVLRRAVGRVAQSRRVGESGNVVLAGHRDTFFRPLEQVRIGDRILLERGGEHQAFEVEWSVVVDPGFVEVMQDSGYPALTLVTCYPFRHVGEAPYRFVVRARRVNARRVASRTAA
jgi:sortase A